MILRIIVMVIALISLAISVYDFVILTRIIKKQGKKIQELYADLIDLDNEYNDYKMKAEDKFKL